MNIPTVPLTAVRNLPFVYPAGFLGEDDGPLNLTGYTLTMEVRLYGKAPGDALISLAVVATDVEGIHILDAAGGLIRILIPAATLDALPGGPTEGAEPNAPDVFVYDMLVVPALPAEPLAMVGTFSLYPGVTEP